MLALCALASLHSLVPARTTRRSNQRIKMAIHTRPREFDATQALENSSAVSDGLHRHGIVRVNGALSPRTASSALSYVNTALEEALGEQSMLLEPGDAFVQRFGKVLSRESSCGTTRRHDLKLSLDEPVVRAAVDELLSAIGPALRTSLGDDAVLYELAALISDPGAPCQPFHPDTRFIDGQGVAVLTAFVALQLIDESMGPTTFLPSSHCEADHSTFNLKGDGGEEAFLAMLRSRCTYRGMLASGDATLFDSRVLHCGGANTSPRRRVLFYASFRAREAKAPPGTLLYDLRERHSLSEWLVDVDVQN